MAEVTNGLRGTASMTANQRPTNFGGRITRADLAGKMATLTKLKPKDKKKKAAK